MLSSECAKSLEQRVCEEGTKPEGNCSRFLERRLLELTFPQRCLRRLAFALLVWWRSESAFRPTRLNFSNDLLQEFGRVSCRVVLSEYDTAAVGGGANTMEEEIARTRSLSDQVK